MITKQPITEGSCHNVKIKMIKYGGQPICIGLMTAKRLQYQCSGDYNHEESIGFWTYNKSGVWKGNILSNGVKIRHKSEDLVLM